MRTITIKFKQIRDEISVEMDGTKKGASTKLEDEHANYTERFLRFALNKVFETKAKHVGFGNTPEAASLSMRIKRDITEST